MYYFWKRKIKVTFFLKFFFQAGYFRFFSKKSTFFVLLSNFFTIFVA
jgi:hypothetical protein